MLFNQNIHLVFALKVLLGCSCACSVANLTLTISDTPFLRRNISLLLSAIFESLALLTLTFLTYYNHQRTRRASSISLLFWPVYGIETLFWAHAIVLPHLSRFRTHLYLRGAVLLLGLVAFSLECIGPEGPVEGENPIVTANMFSRWSYAYMNQLMAKGASQYITEDDLPPVVPEDKSGKLGDALQKTRTT